MKLNFTFKHSLGTNCLPPDDSDEIQYSLSGDNALRMAFRKQILGIVVAPSPQMIFHAWRIAEEMRGRGLTIGVTTSKELQGEEWALVLQDE